MFLHAEGILLPEEGGEYNYLILDEFSSLCRQFFFSTMDENRLINAIIF